MQEKCVVSEKKFGKSFQYDLPGNLVMTYLADVRRYALNSIIMHAFLNTLKVSGHLSVVFRSMDVAFQRRSSHGPVKIKSANFNLHECLLL